MYMYMHARVYVHLLCAYSAVVVGIELHVTYMCVREGRVSTGVYFDRQMLLFSSLGNEKVFGGGGGFMHEAVSM
jgi:hypothetical protein